MSTVPALATWPWLMVPLPPTLSVAPLLMVKLVEAGVPKVKLPLMVPLVPDWRVISEEPLNVRVCELFTVKLVPDGILKDTLFMTQVELITTDSPDAMPAEVGTVPVLQLVLVDQSEFVVPLKV